MLGLEKRDDLQKRTMRDIKLCASVQHLKPTESLCLLLKRGLRIKIRHGLQPWENSYKFQVHNSLLMTLARLEWYLH